MKLLISALLVCMGIFIGTLLTNALLTFRTSPQYKFIVPYTNEQDQEIMDWVIQHIFPNKSVMYNVPLTRRLSRRDIGLIYCGLTGEYCDKEKQKNIGGLFDHYTEVVYVPDNMGECQAKVSLAHEFVHYVQHYRDGNIAEVSEPLQEKVQKLREEEAYRIDDIFENKFCK